MPAPLLFTQNIHLSLGISMWFNRTRGSQYHTPLHLVPFYPPEQAANSIPRFSVLQYLMEHLQAGSHCLTGLMVQSHYLNLVPGLNHTPLNPACRHSAPTLDTKNIFHRHQKGLVFRPYRHGYIAIYDIQQLPDRATPLTVFLATTTFQCFERTHSHHRYLIPREFILTKQFPYFHLHQFQKFLILH